jgi:hypothetical protein
MKNKVKEIVIKNVEFKDTYIENQKCFYVYEIETNDRLDSKAIDSVITQTTNLPTSFMEFMEENNISFEQTLEFLNNNYKKQ